MNVIADINTDEFLLEKGTPRTRFRAFVQDRATETILREALGDLLPEQGAIRRADLATTRRALRQEPASTVLILDVSGEEDPLQVLDDLAQYVDPDVRVLVIGDIKDMEFYRHAIRALGVLEYLAKPLNRDMVARHFRPVIVGTDPADLEIRAGRVIAVMGVRGGVGATTIAVNLAYHLGETTRRNTLLVDADLHGGTAALMLSAKSGGSLRAALERPGAVDEIFLQLGVHRVSDRLAVLCAEESLDEVKKVQPGAITEVLEVLRRHYAFVVVDVPRFATAFNREFLDAAHQRVLVMDASLASIRDTLRFAALPAGAAQPRQPIIVLNHAGSTGTLPLKQVISALGRTPEVIIPHAPKLLANAATIGEPATRSRRGPLRTAMQRLSGEISVTAGMPEGRSFLARLFAR